MLAMRINHNISAMITQGALYNVGQSMQKSLEKLSTGLRINTAADDAAGLGVSENLRTQVTGLSQALRNTQDAISVLNIADGALNEQSNILQRMRDLVIQAKNDTYTSTERAYMGQEFDGLMQELDRIAATANFNKIQIFATPEMDSPGNTIYAADNLNHSPHQLSNEQTISANPADSVFGTVDVASSTHFNFFVGANYNAQDAAAFNNASNAWGRGAADMVTVQFGQMDANALFSPAPDMVSMSMLLETPTANGNNPLGWDPTQDPDLSISMSILSHTATIQDKLNLIHNLIDGDPVDPELTANYFTGGIGNATNLTGLKRVNTMRAAIGAMTNRLEHSVNNAQNQVNNQQSAESLIRDVDFASETATYTRNQILMQSGTAMLAQANSVPQSVMQLLR
jgi:flagellin